MKRLLVGTLALSVIMFFAPDDTFGQRGRRGGGGGGGSSFRGFTGGGGGVSRGGGSAFRGSSGFSRGGGISGFRGAVSGGARSGSSGRSFSPGRSFGGFSGGGARSSFRSSSPGRSSFSAPQITRPNFSQSLGNRSSVRSPSRYSTARPSFSGNSGRSFSTAPNRGSQLTPGRSLRSGSELRNRLGTAGNRSSIIDRARSGASSSSSRGLLRNRGIDTNRFRGGRTSLGTARNLTDRLNLGERGNLGERVRQLTREGIGSRVGDSGRTDRPDHLDRGFDGREGRWDGDRHGWDGRGNHDRYRDHDGRDGWRDHHHHRHAGRHHHWHRHPWHYDRWYHGHWFSFLWNRPWYGSSWYYGPSYRYSYLPVGWGYGPIGYYSGYYSYDNPYYVPNAAYAGTYLDYSHPLYVQETIIADAGDALQANDPTVQLFNEAQAAFEQGNYRAALDLIDRALEDRPNDAAMHEFRALVLFAMGDYQPAAAAVHAILAVGPGWDWETLRGLYPNVDTYTVHLRALEQYRREHPDSADARFLLAYHYISTGHNEAAARELEEVVRILPNDRLAAQLLRTVTAAEQRDLPAASADQPPRDASPEPPTEAPADPVTPVDAEALAGNWKAMRGDDSFELVLNEDETFTWTFSGNGQPQVLKGTYTLANDILVLEQSDGQAMVGRVRTSGEDAFNFNLIGGPQGDEGLDFQR